MIVWKKMESYATTLTYLGNHFSQVNSSTFNDSTLQLFNVELQGLSQSNPETRPLLEAMGLSLFFFATVLFGFGGFFSKKREMKDTHVISFALLF